MRGKVVQVNISPGGLPKRAVAEGQVMRGGIRGDSWNHPKFHGGPRQALLLIAEEAIEALREKGYPLFAGALGENITMRGLDPAAMRLGQRYRVGTAICELTKVRVPCHALDVYGPPIKEEIYDKEVKAGNYRSPRWGLSGFYASIIEEGVVTAGSEIELLEEYA